MIKSNSEREARIGGGPTAGRAGLHRTSPDRCVDRVEGKTRPNRTQIESIESGKDMTNRKQMSFLSLTLLAASLALPAMAQTPKPRLTEFDAPGAGTVSSPECAPSCGTLAYANNIEGAIVGYYTDTNIVPHAFLRTRDGQITSFDAPGAGLGYGLNQGTVAYSINDLGVITGEFQDSGYVYHGFVRFPNGSFATFDAAGAGTAAYQGTSAFSINPEGATTGTYIDGNNVYHGFARSPRGEITSFDPPGSTFTYPCEETCISPDGTVAGFYSDANNVTHGFVRTRDGTIAEFEPPRAGTGAYQGGGGASINPQGTIPGYFFDANNVAHGFVRTHDGHFTEFDAPGASGIGTAVFSINLFEAVTGEFFDANNAMHGFSRSAQGVFATFDAPDAGTGASQGTRPSTNNADGAVAGWYVDANNLNHGFVWHP
jgi:hypothetical protein